MSSEDKSRKTEQPSHHKLRKAREKGQIAKSREVASAASLIFTLGVLALTAGMIGSTMLALTDVVLGGTSRDDGNVIADALVAWGWAVARASAPVAAAGLVIGIAAYLAQFGFLFAPEQIKPSLNKINPIEGAKRMFSGKRLLETVKAIVKIIAIALVAVFVVRQHMADLGLIVHCGVPCGLMVAWTIIWKILVAMVPVVIALAVLDYRLQRADFIREQRMSKDDVKRENKDTQGNPEVKQTRRERHGEQAESDLRQELRGAAAIVTDGVRLIAIRYDEESQPTPLISVRERGGSAQRALALAERLQRPIVSDWNLVNTLWPRTKAGEPPPRNTFDAVAQAILASRRLREGG